MTPELTYLYAWVFLDLLFSICQIERVIHTYHDRPSLPFTEDLSTQPMPHHWFQSNDSQAGTGCPMGDPTQPEGGVHLPT